MGWFGEQKEKQVFFYKLKIQGEWGLWIEIWGKKRGIWNGCELGVFGEAG